MALENSDAFLYVYLYAYGMVLIFGLNRERPLK